MRNFHRYLVLAGELVGQWQRNEAINFDKTS